MASWAAEEVTPDPKSERRHKATAKEWETIRASFADACCVHCGLPAQSLHHILPRGQSGSDVIENLAPLCGDGTRGCHGILECHSAGWERVAASVRQYVMSDNARRHYQEEHAPGFSLRYPALANTDPEFQQDFQRVYGRSCDQDAFWRSVGSGEV